jgi:hypothetical protein
MSAFRSRPRALLLILALGSLAILAGVGSRVFFAANVTYCSTFNGGVCPTWNPKFFSLVNPKGYDVVADKSLTRMGSREYTEGGNDYYEFLFSWNAVNITGSSTLDACLLLDNSATSVGNATNAICAEAINTGASNTPVPKLTNLSGLYPCSGTLKPNNCSGAPSAPVASNIQMGDLNSLDPTIELTTKSDPWGPGSPWPASADWPYDTTVRVKILKTDLDKLGKIINLCSYASGSFSSDPSDCLLPQAGPPIGLLNVQKNVTGGDGTFNFNVSPVLDGTTGQPSCNNNWTKCLAYSIQTQTGTGGVTVPMIAGTGVASVQEQDPSPAYSLASIVCVPPNPLPPPDPGTTGTVDLVNRQVTGIDIIKESITTCTFTNSKNKAHVAVTKKITNSNGGTANASDFSITLTDQSNVTTTVSAGTTAQAQWTQPDVQLPEGKYTLGETPTSPGYSASYTGDCAGQTLQVSAGQSYSCTVTNTDIAPVLALQKQVTNAYGGTTAAPGAFTLTAKSSTTTISGTGSVSSSVPAGTYTLSESGPAAYKQSGDWSCTNGVSVQNGNQITLTVGQHTTCTVTNAAVQPKLTVIKHVNNTNGGTLQSSNFTMQVKDGSNNVVASFNGADTPGATIGLNAGGYTVSEVSVSGYTAQYSLDCSGTLSVGDNKTCTVTNQDQAGTLTVIKHVVNSYGGTATANQFTMHVTAGSPSVNDFPGSETGVQVLISAGSFSVTEAAGGPNGYKASPSGCSGTMTVGGSATCTITNNDTQPQLIINKVMNITHGGTLTAANFSGTATVTGGGASYPWSGAQTTIPLATAGSYTVSEKATTGYTPSFSVDCVADNTGLNGVVSVAMGQTKTCTITNSDQQGTLVVNKVVSNTHGGQGIASNFGFQVNGGNTVSFVQTTDTLHGSNSVKLNAGNNYTITEPSNPAYTSTSDCINITIANGVTTTCTITNQDKAPQLTIKKSMNITHGGTLTAANFSGAVSTVPPSSTSYAWTGASTTIALATGGSYKVAETAVTGYAPTFGGDCAPDGTVSVVPGDAKTCTIINSDQQGTLTIIKHVSNTHGGGLAPSDFTLNVTAGHPSSTSVKGSDAGVAVMIDAGAYTVAETAVKGYAPTPASCTGTMTNGGALTCTITNNDVPPQLTLTKNVTNNNGGTALNTAWTLNATVGPTPFSGKTGVTSDANFKSGTYTLSESGGPDGYSASGWTCTGGGSQNGNQITLNIGDVVNCSITNDDIPPVLTLTKNVQDPYNDPSLPPSSFTVGTTGGPTNFSGAGSASSPGTFRAGTYTLSESGPSGYTAGAWVCTGQGTQPTPNQITLGIGQTASCTIINTLLNIPPNVSLTKTAFPKNLDSSGGTVTFTVTIKNLSGIWDPFTITSLTDDTYGDLNTGAGLPAPGKTPGSDNCANLVGTVIPGGGSITCTFTGFFPPVPTNEVKTETDTVTVTGTDDDNAGASSLGQAKGSATVTEVLPIAITSGNCAIDNFTRIFSQDSAYQYTATNPGQFFYNLGVAGTPGTTKHVTLQLPWPFITQGSQPITVYDTVGFAGGCYSPSGSTYSINNITYLKGYGIPLANPTGYPPQHNPLAIQNVELDVKIPSTGFAFLVQHLDDGLKGPYVDVNGDNVNDVILYGTDPAGDATDPNTGNILMPQGFSHPFEMSACLDPIDSCTDPMATVTVQGGTTFTNNNQFQKLVGVSGQVTYNGAPVPGMTVQLSGKTLLGAAITDSNGQYTIAYKAKNGNFTVTLVDPLTTVSNMSGGGAVTISGYPGSTSTSVNLKSGGSATVNFGLIP